MAENNNLRWLNPRILKHVFNDRLLSGLISDTIVATPTPTPQANLYVQQFKEYLDN